MGYIDIPSKYRQWLEQKKALNEKRNNELDTLAARLRGTRVDKPPPRKQVHKGSSTYDASDYKWFSTWSHGKTVAGDAVGQTHELGISDTITYSITVADQQLQLSFSRDGVTERITMQISSSGKQGKTILYHDYVGSDTGKDVGTIARQMALASTLQDVLDNPTDETTVKARTLLAKINFNHQEGA